jgi:hypothetical protein
MNIINWLFGRKKAAKTEIKETVAKSSSVKLNIL